MATTGILPAELLAQVFERVPNGTLAASMTINRAWFAEAARELWGRGYISLTRHACFGSLEAASPSRHEFYAAQVQKLWVEAHAVDEVLLCGRLIESLKFPRLYKYHFQEDKAIMSLAYGDPADHDAVMGLERLVRHHLILPHVHEVEYDAGPSTGGAFYFRPEQLQIDIPVNNIRKLQMQGQATPVLARDLVKQMPNLVDFDWADDAQQVSRRRSEVLSEYDALPLLSELGKLADLTNLTLAGLKVNCTADTIAAETVTLKQVEWAAVDKMLRSLDLLKLKVLAIEFRSTDNHMHFLRVPDALAELLSRHSALRALLITDASHHSLGFTTPWHLTNGLLRGLAFHHSSLARVQLGSRITKVQVDDITDEAMADFSSGLPQLQWLELHAGLYTVHWTLASLAVLGTNCRSLRELEFDPTLDITRPDFKSELENLRRRRPYREVLFPELLCLTVSAFDKIPEELGSGVPHNNSAPSQRILDFRELLSDEFPKLQMLSRPVTHDLDRDEPDHGYIHASLARGNQPTRRNRAHHRFCTTEVCQLDRQEGMPLRNFMSPYYFNRCHCE